MKTAALLLLALACVCSTFAQDERLSLLRQRADQGDVYAMAELAELLLANPQADGKTIRELAKNSASTGHPHGQYLLGLCYADGVGGPKDEAIAFQFYEMAARQGFPAALNAAGYCHLYGLGTSMDPMEAYAKFIEGALLGNANAKYNLGYLYEQGLGVDKNQDEAIYWYRRAARDGSTSAQERLRVLGYDVVPQRKRSLPETRASTLVQEGKLPPSILEQATAQPSHPQDTTPLPIAEADPPTPPAREAEILAEPTSAVFHTSPTDPSLSRVALLSFLLVVVVVIVCWWFFRHQIHALRTQQNPSGEPQPPQEQPPKPTRRNTGWRETTTLRKTSINRPRFTFNCIQCGQLLLIPVMPGRRHLECPNCHGEYTVWKDSGGVVRLENQSPGERRKTYISFGEKDALLAPHEILGVDPEADADEVQEAYRQKIKESPPDRVATLGVELQELAELKSREINEAYRTMLERVS